MLVQDFFGISLIKLFGMESRVNLSYICLYEFFFFFFLLYKKGLKAQKIIKLYYQVVYLKLKILDLISP